MTAALFTPAVAAAEKYDVCYKDLELSDEDIELTAKAVRSAAEGKNFLVKAAVTAIIYNRVKDQITADSVKGAVSCALPGLGFEDPEKDPSSDGLEEYKVLARLVYEYGIDPSCGAVFPIMP